MNRNANRSTRALRGKLLASAIVATLGIGLAGGASAEPIPASQAGYVLAPPGLAWTQTVTLDGFLKSIDNAQTLEGGVGASLSGGDSIFVEGDLSGAPVTNSGGVLQAGIFDSGTGLSGANGADNAIGMAQLGRDGGDEGLGILSGQLVDGQQVRSSVDGGRIDTTLANYVSGDVTHSDNAVQALTSLNSASNRVAGDLADSFGGTTAGAVNFSYSPTASTTLDGTAGVFVGNVQTSIDATEGTGDSEGNAMSYAHVVDSGIAVVDQTASASTPLEDDVSVSDNGIAATYAGNQSDNRFQATGGTAFEGTVGVANAQVNRDTGDLQGHSTALVHNSAIGASLAGSLDGALTLSQDTITAGSQGNAATNVLAFAQGVDVHGLSVAASITQATNTTAGGDLVLASVQRNQNSTSDSLIDGGSSILGSVSSLSAGSAVTLDGDSIQSSAGGNRAANQVSADSTVFDANASVGNQQVNQDTLITSRVRGAMIASGVLGDTTSTYEGLDDISHGAVTVSGSTIAAKASGNHADTAVDLHGGQFTTWNGVDSVLANGSATASTGSTGVGVANQQSNVGGTVTALVDSGTDAFGTHGGWIGAYFNGGVEGSAVSTNDDVVSAAASGNTATTGIEASGTNGQVNAQLASVQSNGSLITALTDDARIGIYLGGGSASDATLTVSGGAISTRASGNQASNSFGVDFVNQDVGRSSQTNIWDAASSAINSAAETNASKAALAIANTQKNANNVTALTSDGFIGAEVGEHPWPGLPGADAARGNVTGGSVTVSGASMSASATANSVGNDLHVGSDNMRLASGHADQVASLGNFQEDMSTETTALVTTGGTDARKLEQIGAIVHGHADGTALSVSDNGVDAFAGGNLARNTLSADVGNYEEPEPSALAADVGYASSDAVSGLDTVSAAFALQSVQVSGEGSRTAVVSSGNVGINLTDGAPDDRHAVSASTLAVSGNQVSAEARDNQAVNLLGVGVAYPVDAAGGISVAADPAAVLDTTAALQSRQSSSSDVTAVVAPSLVGVVAGHYDFDGDAVGVTDNRIAATGVGNSASNRMDVAAVSLQGNGNLPSGSTGTQQYDDFQGAGADYTISSLQQRDASVQALLAGAGVGLGIGEGDLDGGSVTVSGNAQSALAQQNSVANTLNLQGSSVAATAALASSQFSTGSATALATTDVADGLGFAVQVNGSVGTDTALPVTVSGNRLTAQAGQNDATNLVQVTADSGIAGTAGASADSVGDTLADIVLANDQRAVDSVTAVVSPGLTGLEVVGNDASATSSVIGQAGQATTLDVSDNQFVAQANANQASNAIALNGAASIGASAALSNRQDAADTVTATVSDAAVGIYNRDAGLPQGGTISGAGMTVSGNTLAASASGNSAGNSLAAQPTALNAAGYVDTHAFSNSAGPGSSSVTADYAVLNAQRNLSSVTASVSGSSIGVNAGARGSASQMLDSVATVGGNRALASASGNSASNGIVLASVAGALPSASLASAQLNTAAITANVHGVSIGVTAGGVSGVPSNSPVTITGNVISASAAGNSAVNSIGIGN